MIRLSSSSERVKVFPLKATSNVPTFLAIAQISSPLRSETDRIHASSRAAHRRRNIGIQKLLQTPMVNDIHFFGGSPVVIVGCWEHRQVLPHDGSDPVPGAWTGRALDL